MTPTTASPARPGGAETLADSAASPACGGENVLFIASAPTAGSSGANARARASSSSTGHRRHLGARVLSADPPTRRHVPDSYPAAQSVDFNPSRPPARRQPVSPYPVGQPAITVDTGLVIIACRSTRAFFRSSRSRVHTSSPGRPARSVRHRRGAGRAALQTPPTTHALQLARSASTSHADRLRHRRGYNVLAWRRSSTAPSAGPFSLYTISLSTVPPPLKPPTAQPALSQIGAPAVPTLRPRIRF